MRALLLLAPFLLLACSTTSNVVAPPSTAPIRGKIQSAREAVTRAQTHAGKLKAAIATAKKLAPPTVPDLSVALNLADNETDALTQELVQTQAALAAGDANAVDLQIQVNSLAKYTNDKIKENNALIIDRDKTRRKYHTVKFLFCAAAAAVAALLAFQFRKLLALLGPWGLVGGLVGLPAIVFGFLWIRL